MPRTIVFLNKHKNILLRLGIALLAAVIFLLLFSQCSPLYPCNDWQDVDCFLTVGREVLHGKIMYADIYEQKGPIHYWFYALAALISDTTYIGVFVLEVLCMTLFVYYCEKTAELFVTVKRAVWIFFIDTLICFMVFTSMIMCHCASLEETSLFMPAGALYHVLRAEREHRALSLGNAFLIGCFAGVALWTKYTLLAFYGGLALWILIRYCADRILIRRLLPLIGAFLGGMAVVSAPVVIYFIVHGQCLTMLRAYFYDNIFLYSTRQFDYAALSLGVDAGDKTGMSIRYISYLVRSVCLSSAAVAAVLVPSLLYYFCSDKDHMWCKLIVPFCGLAMGVSMFMMKAVYPYYNIMFYCFFGYYIGTAAKFLTSYDRIRSQINRYTFTHAIAYLMCLVMLGSAFIMDNTASYKAHEGVFDGNGRLMLTSYDDTYRKRFADIINSVSDSTVLTVFSLDGGIYIAADKEPADRYFCYLNVELDDMFEVSRDAFLDGKVDFLLMQRIWSSSYDVTAYFFKDTIQYDLIDVQEVVYEGGYSEWLLWARKELGLPQSESARSYLESVTNWFGEYSSDD